MIDCKVMIEFFDRCFASAGVRSLKWSHTDRNTLSSNDTVIETSLLGDHRIRNRNTHLFLKFVVVNDSWTFYLFLNGTRLANIACQASMPQRQDEIRTIIRKQIIPVLHKQIRVMLHSQ